MLPQISEKPHPKPPSLLGRVAIVIGCVLYCVSPIDLVPDALLPVGFIDDIAVIVCAYQKLFGRSA